LPDPAPPSWPAPPEPAPRPAPDLRALEAITGRAGEVPGFWAFAGTLGALLLVPSIVLVVWAAFSSATNRSRGPQIVWAMVLAVGVLALVARYSRTGTMVDDRGITRITVLRSVRIDWAQVTGFSPASVARPWMTMTTSHPTLKTTTVPSSLVTMPRADGVAMARALNDIFETEPVTFPIAVARRNPDIVVTWWTRSWILPLVTLGLTAPVVFLLAGIFTRRQWVFLVFAGSLDLTIVGSALANGPAALEPVAAVCLLALWSASSVIAIVSWRRARSTVIDTV
jgi:hypothetical protein